MTIDFYKEELEKERKNRGSNISGPYVGYFTPDGKIIDFSIKYGGTHHDDWVNPVPAAFLKFVSYTIGAKKDSFYGKYLREHSPKKYDLMTTDDCQDLICRGYNNIFNSYEELILHLESEIRIKEEDIRNFKGTTEEELELHLYDKFTLDWLNFLRDAYRDKNFFETIGKEIRINERAIAETYPNDWNAQKIAKREALMSYFKDLCIMYLGYDSIETHTPRGVHIDVDKIKEKNIDVYHIPRVITTSCLNPNERFFKYLIMGWTVNVLPRYTKNEITGLYRIREMLYFHSTKANEEREAEYFRKIKEIRATVPLAERIKFL